MSREIEFVGDDKIVVFPKVAAFSENFDDTDNDEQKIKKIEQLTRHYGHQLLVLLQQHGVELNQSFFKDFEISMQMFSASIARNAGIFHPMQSVIDDLYDASKQEDNLTNDSN